MLVEEISRHVDGDAPDRLTPTVSEIEIPHLMWILSQNRFNLAEFYKRAGNLEGALEEISASLEGIGNLQMVIARLLTKAWLLDRLGYPYEARDEIAMGRSIDCAMLDELTRRFSPEYPGLDQLVAASKSLL